MFPLILHRDDLVSQITKFPEFGVYNNPNGTTVVCYAIADKHTFHGEKAAYKRECRGITFDANGKILAHALHKFFNIGENDESRPENIPWDDISRVMTKEDGSMITPMIVDGNVVCKTKRSFDGLEARAATKYLHDHPEKLQWVRNFIERGLTPIFEWVSPESPIVLTSYPEPELILLQIRHMTTGIYVVDKFNDENFCKLVPFKIAENHIEEFSEDGRVSFEKLAAAARALKNAEGWVVQARDGRMWKMKTDWYFSVHQTMTFLRWRDLLVAARDDRLDDIRGAFFAGGRDTGVIDFVERWVNETIAENLIDAQKSAIFIDTRARLFNLSEAQIVESFRDLTWFKEAMRIRRGLDISLILRKRLFQEQVPRWSLKVIDGLQLAKWTLSDAEAYAIGGNMDL